MHKTGREDNRICSRRWRAREHELHRRKLRQIRRSTAASVHGTHSCSVSTAISGSAPSSILPPPPQYPHVARNLKKQQQLVERSADIDRDNKILLQKMARIVRRSDHYLLARRRHDAVHPAVPATAGQKLNLQEIGSDCLTKEACASAAPFSSPGCRASPHHSPRNDMRHHELTGHQSSSGNLCNSNTGKGGRSPTGVHYCPSFSPRGPSVNPTHATLLPPPTSARTVPSSLNREFRRKELNRICRENQLILNRLDRVQPVCNKTEWKKHEHTQWNYMKTMCQYPLVPLSGNTSHSRISLVTSSDPASVLRKSHLSFIGNPRIPGDNSQYAATAREASSVAAGNAETSQSGRKATERQCHSHRTVSQVERLPHIGFREERMEEERVRVPGGTRKTAGKANPVSLGSEAYSRAHSLSPRLMCRDKVPGLPAEAIKPLRLTSQQTNQCLDLLRDHTQYGAMGTEKNKETQNASSNLLNLQHSQKHCYAAGTVDLGDDQQCATQSDRTAESSRVVHKDLRHISGIPCLVEFRKTNLGGLILSVYANQESQSSESTTLDGPLKICDRRHKCATLKMSPDQHEQLLSEDSYDGLVGRLRLRFPLQDADTSNGCDADGTVPRWVCDSSHDITTCNFESAELSIVPVGIENMITPTAGYSSCSSLNADQMEEKFSGFISEMALLQNDNLDLAKQTEHRISMLENVP
eukprot:GHVQ01007904.1.p1 GENE.GHVQ01007904.1~~GHVQ01007904.1.p1  ORF type:complete len:699 (+),score=66.30 GHVQ01007904.1:670-2766(+)